MTPIPKYMTPIPKIGEVINKKGGYQLKNTNETISTLIHH